MDLFRDWDENQDGLISVQEFVKAMAPLGLEVTREEATELFDEFDPDGSGTIEFKELNALLRRKVDVTAEKRAKRLAASRSSPDFKPHSRLLPQPTIPLHARLPSVASLPRLESTLGGTAHTRCTDFDPATFMADGRMADGAELPNEWASRGGRTSQTSLSGVTRKDDRALSHYASLPKLKPEGMSMSSSLPSLLASEVARYRNATVSEARIRTQSIALLTSSQLPTNTWDWPAVQGVPNLDHLAQLWLAPRIGPAWRHQPNQTQVHMPPLKPTIELARQQAKLHSNVWPLSCSPGRER